VVETLLGVVLRVRGPAADVRGDLLLLETAVSNLIENALRHGAGGAAIEVVIEADVDEVRLGVLDAGPGSQSPIATASSTASSVWPTARGLASGSRSR
jgi:K+-sensing histidine kinase KdpD